MDLSIAKIETPDRLIYFEPSNGRLLISCEIEAWRPGIWEPRTYQAIRVMREWRIDFGEGRLEPRGEWYRVAQWFCNMRPRNIELAWEGNLTSEE